MSIGSHAMENSLSWISKGCLKRWGEEPLGVEPLASNGSNRRFYRVYMEDWSLVALWNPRQVAENDAYWNIGLHLKARGVPIPELYEYSREQGLILVQDLGDVSLHEAVSRVRGEDEPPYLYGPVLDALLTLQTRGLDGFQQGWCYQGARYDRQLMLDRESGYFLEAFLLGYCGWKGDTKRLLGEFERLAQMAERVAPARFLIHRDFQSRNILLDPAGRPGIIDFQGARLGPLQYDVASLVLDPYVDISLEARGNILRHYVLRLEQEGACSPEEFLEGYPLVALHRNLQILGAFAYLGKERGKPFFLQWIPRAVAHLKRLLDEHPEWPCPYLRDTLGEVQVRAPGQG